jgi:hypothetical protein
LINILIERISKCEVCECGWKFIDLLVELVSSFKMGESWWESINMLVKNRAKCEVSESGWKIVDSFNWFVVFNFEVSDYCGWTLIQLVSCSVD